MPRSSIGRNTWRPPPDCSMRAAHTRNSAVWPMASSLPAGHVGAPGSVTTSDSGDEFGDHACALSVGQGDRRHVRIERFEHDPFVLPATFTLLRRRLLASPALQRVAAGSLDLPRTLTTNMPSRGCRDSGTSIQSGSPSSAGRLYRKCPAAASRPYNGRCRPYLSASAAFTRRRAGLDSASAPTREPHRSSTYLATSSWSFISEVRPFKRTKSDSPASVKCT